MSVFDQVEKNLIERGYTVKIFATGAEAAAYLDKEIDGLTVGIGGSATVRDIGLYELLEKHNQVIWHWKQEPGPARIAAMNTDVYLCSANALAESGEMVNIDGAGNRVAATLFGHKKVYFLIGKNKLVPSFHQAVDRARNVAAPKRAQQLKTPAVIYTQPVTFNSRRLAIQLATILTVVLALVLGMSVFFKVEVISVVGANVYSEWTIREQSGINEGDNLLTFGRTKASGQIIANLPYVKSARIGIKLPDTVIIEIEEEAVVYSIQDQDGVWWLINSDGKVVEQTSAQSAKTHTQVLGVTLYQPQPGEPGIATEEAPTETDASGEAVQVLVTGAQRLNAALKILQALELNDIVGDAASVDVSQLQDIILWYGTQYQVNLGSINNSKYDIAYKITYMKNAILQMSDYQTGVLDVSFTTWPDQIGYTPFG